MFIGHFALGLALKRAAPKTNLGWLIASVLFLDLLWPIFLLIGLERVEVDPGNTAFTPLNFASYPYTHSALFAAGWSVLFAIGYYTVSRYGTGAIVVGAGVFSHWVLDLIVHRPDLPLFPGSEKCGLGIWNSVPATLILESAMFLSGVWIYTRVTRSLDPVGTYAFWSFVALLYIIYIGNLVGPPPPDPTAVAAVTLALWLFPFWAAWADRHRTVII